MHEKGRVLSMDKHTKKMIAPVIITIIFILYYIIFFVLCAIIPLPLFIRLPFVLIPLLLTGVCLYVLRERIKEIRSGEEDDLGKY